MNRTAPFNRMRRWGGISLDQLILYGGIALGLLIVALVFALPTGSARAKSSSMAAAEDFRQLKEFTLTDSRGRTIRRAELEGQYLVVNFIFTGCSLSCLRVNDRMAEIQKALAGQQDVRLVSLTVDPDSDTPESLASFAERFSANTDSWHFLTGDKEVLYSLLEHSFLGPAKPELKGIVPGGFSNTDRIALVDKRGRVRATFNGLRASAAREVVDALNTLRSSEKSSP